MKLGTPRFVGARLSEAREARGLTPIALADLAGVTRQSIYQYEGGQITPHHTTLSRLAEILNLPIRFFLKPAKLDTFGTVFNRSMAAATKTARLRGESRLRWLKEVFDYLEAFVDFPVSDFPDFLDGKNALGLSSDEIESIAERLRAYWRLGTGPISNLVWLLENKGTIISRIDLEAETMDALSAWCGSTGRPFIVLGLAHGSAARSRLDLAHELGHMILHRGIVDRDVRSAPHFKALEAQAFRFAGAFLFPAEEFVHSHFRVSLDQMLHLKPSWKVSVKMQIMRSFDLDLIDDMDKRNLFKYYSGRGWIRGEPWDDEIPLEQPRLLASSVELLINEQVLLPERILDDLPFNILDIENLVGLPERYFARSGAGARLSGPLSEPIDNRRNSSRPFSEIISFPDRSQEVS